MRLVILSRSVGLNKKKNFKKTQKKNYKALNRRPGTPASLLWSCGNNKTRHAPKINMTETLVDVTVEKLRLRRKKDP